MKKILIDTDILIDYSKGYDRLLGKLLKQQKEGMVELFVTPINITEFMTDRSLDNDKHRQQAQDFLNLFSLINIGKDIGFLAGLLLRERKTKYLGDAIVGATAVIDNLELATRNRHDFMQIPQLKIFRS